MNVDFLNQNQNCHPDHFASMVRMMNDTLTCQKLKYYGIEAEGCPEEQEKTKTERTSLTNAESIKKPKGIRNVFKQNLKKALRL